MIMAQQHPARYQVRQPRKQNDSDSSNRLPSSEAASTILGSASQAGAKQLGEESARGSLQNSIRDKTNNDSRANKISTNTANTSTIIRHHQTSIRPHVVPVISDATTRQSASATNVATFSEPSGSYNNSCKHNQQQIERISTRTNGNANDRTTTTQQRQQQVAREQPNAQAQDSKRTLIKNQLYLIEHLQLENADLRNERDQLQLENEELKFQLQMIR